MITIIKPGKKYKEFCFAKCPKCECEFKFEAEDIIKDSDGPYFSTYIRCPNPDCDNIVGTWRTENLEVE